MNGLPASLRTMMDEPWGLSACTVSRDGIATVPVPGLTTTASGALRPLELKAISQWL